MLDQIDVNKTVDKETYRAARENLGAELGRLRLRPAWAFSRDGLRMRRSRSSSPLTASMLRERASRSAV